MIKSGWQVWQHFCLLSCPVLLVVVTLRKRDLIVFDLLAFDRLENLNVNFVIYSAKTGSQNEKC